MKKKFLCMFTVAVTVTAFFCINASAALTNSRTWLEENFTRPEDQIENVNWLPEDWDIAGRTSSGGRDEQNLGIYRVSEEGYVELSQQTYVGYASFLYKPSALPEKFTLMFDVKFPTVGASYATSASVMCSLNNFCQGVYSNGQIPYKNDTGTNTTTNAGAHDADKWYTYIYQVSGDKMSVYRKAEGTASFTTVLENVQMQSRTGHEIWGSISMGDAKMLLDNVKIFSGKSLVDSSIEFNEDKTQITGILTARNGDAAPGSESTGMLVMMAYDAKGKILGMNFAQGKAIPFGDTQLETITLDCSAYYDKLVGGTVELYLWDSVGSFKPQIDACVITVQ